MKHYFLLLCLALVAALNGCKDDDSDDSKPNGFTYKDVFYEAELFGIETFYAGSDYDLRIEISNADAWDENDNQLVGNDFSIVRLRTINRIDGNTLGTGDYFHSATSQEQGIIYGGYESFCFQGGADYNCAEYPDVIGGNLKVSKSGDIYTLEYELTLSNGESFNGYYKGELDYVTQD